MTRPTARVLVLLEVLQSGVTHTTAGLADRLGVDQRTVRRYIAHLIDLEIPVEAVRGRYGGYRLAAGYRMPPLMLTDDEALAVTLGLVAGRRAGLVAGSAAAVEGALAKLRRVLPKPLAARLTALLQITEFTAADRAATGPATEVLLRLADATRDRRPVAISYTGRDGRRSDRLVHPYGVVAHAGRWYVTGADSASGEIRTFRLDRIAHAAVRDGTFTVPADFDPAERVLEGMASTPWRHRISVRVRGEVETLRTRLPAGLATVEPLDAEPGWVRIRLRAERLDWVPRVLAGLDAPFVVDEPAELRAGIRALADRLLASISGQGEAPG